MYDIIDHELMRMGMDFTNLLAVQMASCVAYRCLHWAIHNNE